MKAFHCNAHTFANSPSSSANHHHLCGGVLLLLRLMEGAREFKNNYIRCAESISRATEAVAAVSLYHMDLGGNFSALSKVLLS